MNRFVLAATMLVGLFLAGACEHSDPQRGAVTPEGTPITLAAADFQERLHRVGVVTFRSWNGTALGMDSDTELVFFRDGSVGLLEYGYALSRYRGTYEVDPGGRISARFRDFPAAWPDMILERDAPSLLLRPADAETGFIMGGRAGAYVPKGAGTYWPFRMLVGDEEKQILRTLKWCRLTRRCS